MNARVIVNLLAAAVLSLLAASAHAVTKIAPTEAEPGHPFTVIDTSGRRLVDGSVAVFRMWGLEITRGLRTHKPFNTAQGRLAPDMYGGVYAVSVRLPDGTEFAVGEFTVLGPTAPPPWIEPPTSRDFTLDEGNRVSASVQPQGGVISTSSNGITYTLSLPPNALKNATEISLTPVLRIENLPMGKADIAAAHLSPPGLVLDVPATLTVELLPGTVDGRIIVGFIVQDDGRGFEILKRDIQGNIVTLNLAHFSVAGMVEAKLEEAKDYILNKYYGVDGFLDKLSLSKSCNDKALLDAAQHAADLVNLADDFPESFEFGTRRCIYDEGYQLLWNNDICPFCREPVPVGVFGAVIDDPKCSSAFDLGEAARLSLWNRAKEIFLVKDAACQIVNPAEEIEALSCIAFVQGKKDPNLKALMPGLFYKHDPELFPDEPESADFPGDALFSIKSCGLYKFRVEPDLVEMTVGGFAALQAIATDRAGNPLTNREIIWQSSDSSVASAASNGYSCWVTGEGGGIANIMSLDKMSLEAGTTPAQGYNADETGIYVDTLISPPEGLKVRVSPDEVCLPVFQGKRLSARVLDLNDRRVPGIGPFDVVWYTPDSSIASVNIEGLVVAQSPGRVQIQASYEGATGFSSIFVPKFPDDYSLTPVLDLIDPRINDDREPVGNIYQLAVEAEERCGLDLPDIPPESVVLHMNNKNQVTALVDFMEGEGAVGVFFDLNTCAFATFKYPNSGRMEIITINDNGQILGAAEVQGPCFEEQVRFEISSPSEDIVAFIYDPLSGSFTDVLSTRDWVYPIDMNNHQEVIGVISKCDFEWSEPTQSWWWTGEAYSFLNGRSGFTRLTDTYKHQPVFTFEPAAINDKGYIVGYERGVYGKGTIYSQGSYITPDLPAGSEFIDINNSDDILVGRLPTAENPEGYFIMHLCPLVK